MGYPSFYYVLAHLSTIQGAQASSCIPSHWLFLFFLWRFGQMPRQTLNVVKAPGREMGWCDSGIDGHGVEMFCLVMSHEIPIHGPKILAHSLLHPFTAYLTWGPCRLIALRWMAWGRLGTMLHLSGIGWKLGSGLWHARVLMILPSLNVSKIKRY